MNTKLFSISEALKVGWGKAKSNVGAFFLIFVVFMIFSAIMGALAPNKEDASILANLVILLGWLVGVFLQMGVTRVVLKVLDGGKASISDFTSHAEQFIKFLFGIVLSGIIVGIGFVLFIIPGIIFSIRLQFIPYLIIEKNLGPMEALARSWAITKGQTWNLFLFGLVSALIGILGFVALIIGLFWAIPTVMIAAAFVYRKLDHVLNVEVLPAPSASI